MRLALAFYGVLFAAALVWSALARGTLPFATGVAAQRGMRPLRDVGAGLLAAALVVLVSRQLTERTGFGRRLARTLAVTLGPLSLSECWLLALVSGVAEEAFFRGALQPQLGLVAASLLFGAAHFVPRRDLFAWALFSVAAGFLLGWLFEATGSLLAPIVAHAAINGVNLRHLTQHYGPSENRRSLP